MFRELITVEAKQNLKTLVKEVYKFTSSPIQNTQNTSIIGYGHHIKANQTISKQISEAQAQKLLQSDLENTFLEAQKYWGVILKYMGDWRMAAIMDATYYRGLLRWPKLTQQVYMQNWQLAAHQLLDSRYAVQVGAIAKRNAQIIRTNKRVTLQQIQKRQAKVQKGEDHQFKNQ